MDRVQKEAPNHCTALLRRELGLARRYLPQTLFAQRLFDHLAHNRYRQTVYQVHPKTIWRFHVQYPYAITASSRKVMKLWHLGTGKQQWSMRLQTRSIHLIGELKLIEDKVLCVGRFYDSDGLRFMIKVFSRSTGEEVVKCTPHTHPLLDQWTYLTGKEKDFFILEPKEIKRCNLEGKVIQKIEVSRQYHLHQVLALKGFLAIFDKEVLIVHDLNKRDSYQIPFTDPKREVSSQAKQASTVQDEAMQRKVVEFSFSFDGVHLFCATEREIPDEWEMTSRQHPFDYYLFDFDKKSATLLYKREEDNPLFAQPLDYLYVHAVLHKEWVYLGYSSGHVIAVNWMTHTCVKLLHSSHPINHLSVQEGMLIIGSVRLFFWNIHSLKEVGQMEWHYPRLFPIWNLGKLVFTEHSSLVVRDYTTD